jgi:hypothetical protein
MPTCRASYRSALASPFLPCDRQELSTKTSTLHEALNLLSRELDAAAGTTADGAEETQWQPHALLLACQAAGQEQYMLVSMFHPRLGRGERQQSTGCGLGSQLAAEAHATPRWQVAHLHAPCVGCRRLSGCAQLAALKQLCHGCWAWAAASACRMHSGQLAMAAIAPPTHPS